MAWHGMAWASDSTIHTGYRKIKPN